jgi:hypothetical protein
LIEPRGIVARTSAPAATDAQARKSAFIVAGWNLFRGRTSVASVTGALSLLLILVGALWPTGAQLFHRGWMRLAVTLGHVNSRILLTVVYYGLFLPYGVVSRLVRRDPLDRRSPPRETYWVERARTRQTPEQFERLF